MQHWIREVDRDEYPDHCHWSGYTIYNSLNFLDSTKVKSIQFPFYRAADFTENTV